MTSPKLNEPLRRVQLSIAKRMLKVIKWFFIFLTAFIVIYLILIRPWLLGWGASKYEMGQTLPGDELVNKPIINTTRAITINNSPEKVWPWVVQLGLHRGGWYSYDSIEKALGAGDFLDGHAADRVIPELQHLKIGDRIEIAPNNGLTVTQLEPCIVMLLHERVEQPFINWTWVYYLEKIDNEKTRLIIRTRIESDSTSIGALIATYVIMEPGAFIMERKMLKGFKARAETNHSGPF